MPYGIASSNTIEVLEDRSGQANIDFDKLGVEPEFDIENDDLDGIYQLSIIIGGALDEEFYIKTIYEVNIADWLAEDLRDSKIEEPWEIIVSEVAYEDAGTVRYRVTDETVE